MLDFTVNHSSVADIETHLKRCADGFSPPLYERIDIRVYAAKLKEFAVLCEAWEGGELIGLVAGYCNDVGAQKSFISNVSVVRQSQGRGLAKTLLNKFCVLAAQKGFTTVELKVDTRNRKAKTVYENFGFTCKDVCGSDLNMTRWL